MATAQDKITSDFPLYSTGRLVYDFTENSAFPVFGHAFGMKPGDLKLFTYATAEAATLAGFHGSTTVGFGQTNITRKGQVPGGGQAVIDSIAIVFDRMIEKPQTATLQGCTQIAASSHCFTKDVTALNKVFNLATNLFARAYTPYVQFGDSGQKYYLGSIQLLAPARGLYDSQTNQIVGATFNFPTGLLWTDKGEFANLIVGLELTNDQYNPPWAADGGGAATDPGVTVRNSLNYAVAGSQSASAGVVLATLDFKVFLYGRRQSDAGN